MIKNILFIIALFSLSIADEGKTLFYGNCTSCHMERVKPSAPHFSEIKGYYMVKYPKKKEFVKHLTSWVYRPDLKTALLPQAIKKYGQVMPTLWIDRDILEEIASYLYECDEF